MIGRLRGTLLDLDASIAVIDVGGVGYEVEVTATAAALFLTTADRVDVFTHMIARDDAQLLYGFASAAERDLFRSLIKVAGVGPKLAVALLSALAPEALARAIASGDVTAIMRVPGIGRKTANRLIVELKDKVDGLGAASVAGGGNAPAREAVLALIALGYADPAAARVVGEVAEAVADADVETLIREALRRMAAAA